jgi:hypothetical protein
MNNYFKSILLSALLFATLPADASVLDKLRNEPATMLDIAIIRLQELNTTEWAGSLQTAAKKLDLHQIRDGVRYDEEADTITLSVVYRGDMDEEKCTSLIKQYQKDIAGTNLSTLPNPETLKTFKLIFSSLFLHADRTSASIKSGTFAEAADAVHLLIIAEADISDDIKGTSPEYQALAKLKGGNVFYCTTPLFKDKIEFRQP